MPAAYGKKRIRTTRFACTEEYAARSAAPCARLRAIYNRFRPRRTILPRFRKAGFFRIRISNRPTIRCRLKDNSRRPKRTIAFHRTYSAPRAFSAPLKTALRAIANTWLRELRPPLRILLSKVAPRAACRRPKCKCRPCARIAFPRERLKKARRYSETPYAPKRNIFWRSTAPCACGELKARKAYP